MKKSLILLLLIIIPLFADSVVMDTVKKNVVPCWVYYPFKLDTLAVGDSATSVWYFINSTFITGYMTYTIVIANVSANTKIKLYREFTNDTTWNAVGQTLVDSIVANKSTTEVANVKGAAFMRWKVKNFGTGTDKASHKLKFNVK